VTVVVLTETEREFLLEARRIVLCTTAPDGSPRPVPACFALVEDMVMGTRLYTPLDEKPKNTADPHLLARVRDIRARPAVSLLVDRWSEDWARLAWLRLTGSAALLEPDGGARSVGEHAIAVAALRARYPQYARHDLSARPIIRVTLTRTRSWGRLAEVIE
jgi:PPOX class probable F420-dependent enzyme